MGNTLRPLSRVRNSERKTAPFWANPLTITRILLFLLVVAFLLLFAFNSLTRTRNFSLDSMNYVDVARNIAAGRGIVQSTLGYNQAHFDVGGEIPLPLTAQPALYPLIISLFVLTGFRATDAALLIPVLSYAAILVIVYFLAKTTFTEEVGLFAAACLMLYHPLVYVSSHAWSESLGLVFVLTSLAFLMSAYPGRGANARYGLAGLCAGLAFLTRYALLPAFLVGIVAAFDRRSPKVTVRNLALYVGGFAVVAVPTLIRNVLLSGTVMGQTANPSTVGLLENIRDAALALLGGYVGGGLSPYVKLAFLAIVLLGLSVMLAAQGRFMSVTSEITFANNHYILTLWVIFYAVFLVYQRTQTHFNPIDARLIAPAGVVFVLLLAAFIVSAIRRQTLLICVAILVIASLALLRVARATEVTPVYSIERDIASSARLSWIAENTTQQDLIIGNDTVDVPFYFDRAEAISFSPYPYTDWPVYRELDTYVQEHCGRYEHVYLILGGGPMGAEGWESRYGPFVADIVSGQTRDYPNIAFLTQLDDGYIFEFRCESK